MASSLSIWTLTGQAFSLDDEFHDRDSLLSIAGV